MKLQQILKITFLMSFFSFWVYAQEGYPPPCNEIKEVKLATDPVKKKILFQYIQDCLHNQSFNTTYDKGIINLYEYKNSQNQLCWLLFAQIDDSYKDNPPTRFSDFQGEIILIYDADSTGRVLKTSGDKASLNRCLEQIIGDRVFIRPTIKTRWTSSVLPDNEKRKEGNHRWVTGGGGAVIIRFNKDGSYKISPLG
ncbi:hypothetical protein [Spirosoma aerolatum]|uniref:hypothetical protein n=1 Tax=Spirosoma aerolatum TaxID=1211326 RepID=UPI0009AC773F|nr:hypothetical protein [Spirosoma aerolatum]